MTIEEAFEILSRQERLYPELAREKTGIVFFKETDDRYIFGAGPLPGGADPFTLIELPANEKEKFGIPWRVLKQSGKCSINWGPPPKREG